MKKLTLKLIIFFTVSFTTFFGQPSYYDLNFENDSVRSPFSSGTDNYAFVRSKRGVDGVNETPEANALRNVNIQKIILVFSEDTPDDIENREEYNMERWDNLILTYPEFFQEKTKYKNICQCSANAGGESFKQVQGFYIYYKVAEKAVVKEETKAVKPEKVSESEKKPNPANTVIPAIVAGAGVEASKTPKSEEKPKKETESKPESTSKQSKQTSDEADSELEPIEKPLAKTTAAVKKPVSNKPRRAKDPKACRPAFYGSGDEDLDAFFRNSFILDKKQKRQAKKVDAEIRIQLNVDGSVKKVQVICENTEFKEMFEKIVTGMSNWNAAVRGGVTIRSEVRLKVKYDKDSKGFKKYEMLNNPKPAPKCKMQTDEELFGS